MVFQFSVCDDQEPPDESRAASGNGRGKCDDEESVDCEGDNQREACGGDECIYFDKDGIVLAKTKELWDGIPCIEGLEVKKVQLYKELPVSKANKKAFGNLLDMTMTLKKCDLAPDKIVCSGSDLYLFFGNKCVNVGHTNLEERIMQISPILEKLGDQGGTLYLENFNTDNITITFEKDVIPDLGT